jgi:hypothetical protein
MPKSTNDDALLNGSFQRGFKTNAERIAVEYRKQLGLKDFEPLSALKLAAHFEIAVVCPREIPGISSDCLSKLSVGQGSDHWSAITIGREKPTLIIYNDTHSPARTESNLMHEMAHVLLGHEMGEIDTSLGIPLRKYDSVQENEAEWLGGCLQLPKSALLKYFVYNHFSIEQISEMFNASRAMVNYRIGVSGVKAIHYRLGNKSK